MLVACSDRNRSSFHALHDAAGDPVGCYALLLRHRLLDSGYYNSSPFVELDRTPLYADRPRSRKLRRLEEPGSYLDDDSVSQRIPFAWWVDSLTDTLYISFVNGYSGTVLRLHPAGADTLQGLIVESWDLGPRETNHAPAEAIRVRC